MNPSHQIAPLLTASLLAGVTLAMGGCPAPKPASRPATAPTSPEHRLFLEESARQTEAKARLNEKLRDAMNLQVAAARKLAGNKKFTWQEVIGTLPSPAVEIMSGRSSITADPDGQGGWWWDEKRQRLEINAME